MSDGDVLFTVNTATLEVDSTDGVDTNAGVPGGKLFSNHDTRVAGYPATPVVDAHAGNSAALTDRVCIRDSCRWRRTA